MGSLPRIARGIFPAVTILMGLVTTQLITIFFALPFILGPATADKQIIFRIIWDSYLFFVFLPIMALFLITIAVIYHFNEKHQTNNNSETPGDSDKQIPDATISEDPGSQHQSNYAEYKRDNRDPSFIHPMLLLPVVMVCLTATILPQEGRQINRR